MHRQERNDTLIVTNFVFELDRQTPSSVDVHTGCQIHPHRSDGSTLSSLEEKVTEAFKHFILRTALRVSANLCSDK